jgi:hypothetical protein
MTKRRIYIPEIGGIGNQLFCFSYALVLRQMGYAARILPQLTNSDMKFHNKKVRISSLIRRTKEADTVAGALESIALQFLVYFGSALSKFLRLPLRIIENRQEISSIEFPASSSIVVRGYFQNPEIYSSLSLPNKALVSNLLGLSEDKQVAGESEIVLHYRRGDYQSNRETIGLLADDYFVRAAYLGKEILGSKVVRIYSDGDTSDLSKLLEVAGFTVQPNEDPNADVVATFKGLASGSGLLITSNSSFSWWAGALGNYRNVIYPAKWFKGLETVPMNLEGWIPLEPSWMN